MACASAPPKAKFAPFKYSSVVSMRVLSVERGLPSWRGAVPERGGFAVVKLEASYDGNYPEETIDLAKLRLLALSGDSREAVVPSWQYDSTPFSGGMIPAGSARIKLVLRFELAFDLPPGAVPLAITAGLDEASLETGSP